MEGEVPLAGGAANAGLVTRAGDVVLRPSGPHTPAVHALLRHLHAAGFHDVPDPLGLGADGRERLRFIPGDTPRPPFADMVVTMVGIERYERRHQWFERNRRRFADALE